MRRSFRLGTFRTLEVPVSSEHSFDPTQDRSVLENTEYSDEVRKELEAVLEQSKCLASYAVVIKGLPPRRIIMRYILNAVAALCIASLGALAVIVGQAHGYFPVPDMALAGEYVRTVTHPLFGYSDTAYGAMALTYIGLAWLARLGATGMRRGE